MNSHVLCKVTWLWETPITHFALKGFLTSMHAHVCPKVKGSFKMFVTDSALMVLTPLSLQVFLSWLPNVWILFLLNRCNSWEKIIRILSSAISLILLATADMLFFVSWNVQNIIDKSICKNTSLYGTICLTCLNNVASSCLFTFHILLLYIIQIFSLHTFMWLTWHRTW